MNWRFLTHTMTTMCILLALMFALFGPDAAVNAQEDTSPTPEFGIESVDTQGGYFDLRVSAGDTYEIQFAISNSGAIEGEAVVYPSDTYSMVNGGMGVNLAGEPTSGATQWLDYETTTYVLAPNERRIESLTLDVPHDAESGQHLTSLVIEASNTSESKSADGVTFKNVTRQAVAVLITVDGPISPALEIGDATHRESPNTSVVGFTLTNAGNTLLKTTGEFLLRDANGTELVSMPVILGSFYARTEMQAEIPVGFHLEPGDYTATLWLEDAEHDIYADSGPLGMTVSTWEMPKAANPQLSTSESETSVQPAIQTQTAGIPTWVILVAIPLAILAGAVVVYLAMKRKMQPQVQASAAPMQRPPVVTVKRVPVRQIVPPTRQGENG